MGILHIIIVENLFIYLSEAPQSVYIYLADTFFQTESPKYSTFYCWNAYRHTVAKKKAI